MCHWTSTYRITIIPSNWGKAGKNIQFTSASQWKGRSVDSEVNAPTLLIHGLFHCQITDIIRTVCSSKSTEMFCYTPYTMHWHPDPLDPNRHKRVYADTDIADAMVQIQIEVNELPRQEATSGSA